MAWPSDVRLAAALRIAPGQVVTLTGAGGKTSALRCLVRELAPATPVLVTTTTRFGLDQLEFTEEHLVVTAPPEPSVIRRALDERRSVALTGPQAADAAKWQGVPPEWVDGLKAAAGALGGCILVEGDGARQRPLKAPADHEPVVPASSDGLVPVVGLEAIGAPLTEAAAHRPERVGQLAGLSLGERIEVAHLVRLLTASEGALKGRPAGAPARVLLNGAEPMDDSAGQVAQGALAGAEAIEAVLLARVAEATPVLEVRGRTAGVVLAAGASQRMSGLKQLREWRGRPLVSWAVRAARKAGLSPLILVVGEQADRVRAVAGEGVRVVVNEAWNQGQSGSLKAGLRAAMTARVEAAVFLLADMPLVGPALLERLVARHRVTLGPIVAPWAGDRWGNPVLFDRATFEALLSIEGDQGGRALFERFDMVPVEADQSALIDIDSEEDWARLG